MEKNTYGYVRVSGKDQNEIRQIIAMKSYEIAKEHLFIDKASGKDFDRPAYKKMIRKAKRGDTVVIKSIDRLGRDYEEILNQWKLITKDRGVNIIVIDMPILNTKDADELLGTFIADIVLQVLSFVAENERENIKQRQKEGIIAAQARGVKFGRPAKNQDAKFVELAEKWINGEITSRKAAEELDMSYVTFLKWAKEHKEKIKI